MSTTTSHTAEQLLALPTGMGKRYELLAGELREMSPSRWRHGAVVDNVHTLLGSFIRASRLGRGFGAETGFRIARDPDTVRAPDFAFIAKEHLPADAPAEGFWPGAPDLAVEVLSPGDRLGDVDEKIDAWLTAGGAAVWVVDPKLETITVYRSRTEISVYAAGDTFHNEPVVPGFSCAVEEFFQ
jgi:Uma2 family endonuclease